MALGLLVTLAVAEPEALEDTDALSLTETLLVTVSLAVMLALVDSLAETDGDTLALGEMEADSLPLGVELLVTLADVLPEALFEGDEEPLKEGDDDAVTFIAG